MGLKSDKSESGVEKVGQKQMEVETVEANRYNIPGQLKTKTNKMAQQRAQKQIAVLSFWRLSASGETLCRVNCQLIGMSFFYTRSAGKNNRN